MDQNTTLDAPTISPAGADQSPDELIAETLIEEVSIDGMCGVY